MVRVSIALIDDAVKRILKKKFELGLFDDPFKFCNPEREQKELNNPEHTIAARDIARKSIVLLKNQNHLLPLSKEHKNNCIYWSIGKSSNSRTKGFGMLKCPGVDSN